MTGTGTLLKWKSGKLVGAVGVVGPCAKNGGFACDYNEIFSWLFQSSFFFQHFDGFSTLCRKIQKLWIFDAFSDRAEYSSANCSLRICCNLCDFVQKVCPFGIFWELHSLCLASLADKPLLIFMEGKSVVAYPLQTEASHALSIFPESWKSIVDGSHEEWGSCSRIATGVLVIIFGSHMKKHHLWFHRYALILM